ncbi:MAG: hypothetical protein AAB628_02350 [Patescibacteria group bacterium]
MDTIHCSDSREIILRNNLLRNLEFQLADVRLKLQDLYRRADREAVDLVIKSNEQAMKIIMNNIEKVNAEINLIRQQNRSSNLGQTTLAF